MLRRPRQLLGADMLVGASGPLNRRARDCNAITLLNMSRMRVAAPLPSHDAPLVADPSDKRRKPCREERTNGRG